MASSLLDQVKIQAQVLVPILKAFREELGEERANRIAWKALEKWRSDIVGKMNRKIPPSGNPADRFRAASDAIWPAVGDSVDVQMLKDSPEAYEYDVTGCRFAQFFKEVGEPELGFALLCSFDTTMVADIGQGDVKFTRTQTIMQGADHCDFRYALKKRGPSTD
jgi:hypothetical protein